MNNKCCICLEKLKKNGKVIFQCGHSIHLCCFIECLKNDTIFCPLCRRKIEENVEFYNYINLKFSIIIKNLQRMYTIKEMKNQVKVEAINIF